MKRISRIIVSGLVAALSFFGSYRYAYNGGLEHKVSPPINLTQSPDGKRLAFNEEYNPSFSPDGKKIVSVENIGVNYDILIRDIK
jgi:Tol biopolymer transport system component